MLLVWAWVNSDRSSEASEAITPTNFGSLASEIPRDGKISEAFLGGIFPAALTINLQRSDKHAPVLSILCCARRIHVLPPILEH